MKKTHTCDADIWLIGTGPHAAAYVKVLKDLAPGEFLVVGRHLGRAHALAEAEALEPGQVAGGGVDALLDRVRDGEVVPPKAVIISVGVDDLADCAIKFIKAGVGKILLEKPGANSVAELQKIQDAVDASSQASPNDRCSHAKVRVFIAYNRRFYASVQAAQHLIRQDEGVKSFQFDFTEWLSSVRTHASSSNVKDKWAFANSSHVIDLAFFLGGLPDMRTTSVVTAGAGDIDFHPAASAWVGSGVSETGALFAFHANWMSPGRWALEVHTANHKLVFKPMEQLHVVKHDSTAVERVVDPRDGDAFDVRYKPGMLLQTKAFLGNDGNKSLCTLHQHLQLGDFYNRIMRAAASNAPASTLAAKGPVLQIPQSIKRVLLVGVGNIGRRHFESLFKVRVPLDVAVVDTQCENLLASKATLSQAQNSPLFRASFFTDMDSALSKTGKESFDLAIVATTSMPRRSIVERLWEGATVHNVLLEKVVFPRPQDYDEVGAGATVHHSRLFVNVGHRHKWMAALRKEARSPVHVSVTGANWGMACNSVHFVDMFCYLNRAYTGLAVSTDGLRPGYVPAKRDGYVEVEGVLTAALPTPAWGGASDARLHLKCDLTDAVAGPTIVLYGACEEFFFTWDLQAEMVQVTRGEATTSFLYKMPLVSERSHELVESLLLAGQDSQCHVPKYEEVAPPSKRLITAFIDFLAASGNATAAAGVCPIT